MVILFRRATHNRDGKFQSSNDNDEIKKVWNSNVHPGGFIGHMLESKKEISLDELFDNTRRYEKEWNEEHKKPHKILLALSELIRVGAVEVVENVN